MTTNAIDLVQRVIASDSRWSVQIGDQFLFVDDTGFDKIVNANAACAIFAGSMALIDLWRSWFKQPVLNLKARPPTSVPEHGLHIHICMLSKPECRLLYLTPGYFPFPAIGPYEAFFTGTGAEYAVTCFSTNRCSKRSVQSAASADIATGGETKFLEVASNIGNLSPGDVMFAQALEAFKTRGMVMDMNSKKTVSVLECQNAAVKAVLSGGTSLTAPTGRPPHVYSDDDEAELDAALAKIASEQSTDAANE